MTMTVMMQWLERREGLTIEINNVNNECSYYKTMDETICSADHKAHDNHNTAQRADNEDCFL